MSSLPQGWHGIPVPTRNGISSTVTSAASTVPTTIRKKWNSPLSNEVPRSKLPAYKPSTVRLHKSPVNGMLPTRNIAKTTCPTLKSDATTDPPKPSPTKQYQNEIAKLKKELTTLKTENSILKVKVRRVDDENTQKSRQIEKLKVELKAAQKVESANSKKSKDSELLVLRQKCLRLEGALKEKDLALKRLNNEASLKLELTASRNSTTNLAAGDGDDLKWNKQNETSRTLVKPGTAQTNLSRSSHSTKTEVAKLREIIHKLEKENQELQQQVKDKGEEIRRLKMHLRSRTYIKSPQTSDSKNITKVIPTTKLESVPNISKPNKPVLGALKSNKPVSTPEMTKRPAAKAPKIDTSQSKKPDIQSTPKLVSRTNNLAQRNSIAVKKQKTNGKNSRDLKSPPVKKQTNETQPKPGPPVTRPRKITAPTKETPSSEGKNPVENKINSTLKKRTDNMENKNDNILENKIGSIDDKMKEMRENIAAKKIQRSWREHQKRHSGKSDQLNVQKALTFIMTSIKHHKLRKEKINMLRKHKDLSRGIKMSDDSAIVAAVQEAAKSIWEKEMSITSVN